MRKNPTVAKAIARERDSAPERSDVRQSWRKTEVGEWTCFRIIRVQCNRKTNNESIGGVYVETLKMKRFASSFTSTLTCLSLHFELCQSVASCFTN